MSLCLGSLKWTAGEPDGVAEHHCAGRALVELCPVLAPVRSLHVHREVVEGVTERATEGEFWGHVAYCTSPQVRE